MAMINLAPVFDPGDFDPGTASYQQVRLTRVDHDMANKAIRFWSQRGNGGVAGSFAKGVGKTMDHNVSGADYNTVTTGPGDLETQLLNWLVTQGVYGGSVV